MTYISQIVEYVRKAQEIATRHGYKNLLQPGLVKELIIGDLLGHEVHRTKHAADAWDPNNPELKYEYLSCLEKGTFQLDRMFKAPRINEPNLLNVSRGIRLFTVQFLKKTIH